MAGWSSFDPFPSAPNSLTLTTSASLSGIVRGVGAPVAGKAKVVKGVSADARCVCANRAKTPTPPPRLRGRFPLFGRLLVLLVQVAELRWWPPERLPPHP